MYSARSQAPFEFLNPILHPERPGRIPLSVAITVVALFEGRVKIDWALILHDTIHKQVGHLEPIPPWSYVSPFLFHLYQHVGCLSPSIGCTAGNNELIQHVSVHLNEVLPINPAQLAMLPPIHDRRMGEPQFCPTDEPEENLDIQINQNIFLSKYKKRAKSD